MTAKRVAVFLLALTTSCFGARNSLADGDGFRTDSRPVIGVNYFDAFSRVLKNPDAIIDVDLGMEDLGRRGIQLARIMGTGFWPPDMALYTSDREEYFRRFDEVVASAEHHGVGLVVSLFWYYPTVPDLVGEPIQSWGHPDSKTIRWMQEYVTGVVGRYRDRPGIVAWEMGNEWNLAADLPNASTHLPPTRGRGPLAMNPETRDERDFVTREILDVAMSEFRDAVRAIDPIRPLSAGGSIPRSSAWHNTHEGTWGKDNREQFAEMLLRDNPFEWISIHLYPSKVGDYFANDPVDWEDLLTEAQRVADAAGKTLFLGEFGVPRSQDMSPESQREAFRQQLSNIREVGVPVSAVWVYDFPNEQIASTLWNISTESDRAEWLDDIEAANKNP